MNNFRYLIAWLKALWGRAWKAINEERERREEAKPETSAEVMARGLFLMQLRTLAKFRHVGGQRAFDAFKHPADFMVACNIRMTVPRGLRAQWRVDGKYPLHYTHAR